jgi:cell division protein FtsZ
VNEAAEVIHSVAHPDANIIFGAVIDDAMGDEIRVTVIAAGFDRTDARRPGTPAEQPAAEAPAPREHVRAADIFGDDDDEEDLELGDGDDDFDVPSFLR